MKRIAGVVALATLLVACGSGSNSADGGIQLGSFKVDVAGLEPGDEVTVYQHSPAEQLVFTTDGRRAFASQVQDGKRVSLSLTVAAGSKPCLFAANFAPQVAVKRVGEPVRVVCGDRIAEEDISTNPDDPDSGAGMSLTLELLDAQGNLISATEPPAAAEATAVATLSRAGQPVVSEVVMFQSDAADFLPSDASSVTDDDGRAVVEMALRSAGSVVATFVYGNESHQKQVAEAHFLAPLSAGTTSLRMAPASSPMGYDAASAAALVLTTPELDDSALQIGRPVTVTTRLLDSATGTPWSGNATLRFNSLCQRAGAATLSARVNAAAGVAVAEYRPAAGCLEDAITVTTQVGRQRLSASSDLMAIRQNEVTALTFVGAQPRHIGVRGAAQTRDASTLVFRALDADGMAVTGVPVQFSLPEISAAGTALVSAARVITDQQGDARVTLSSGSMPGVGVVAAQVADTDVVGVGQVRIGTGVASQAGFHLRLDTLNPAAGDHAGVPVGVSVRVADRNQHPVPDGTLVNFSTDLGDIAEQCVTQGGLCAVEWISDGSSAVLAGGNSADTSGRHQRYGRSSVHAWTVGEDSFRDADNNGLYDLGEAFFPLADAAAGSASGERMFRGVACSAAAEQAGHCAELTPVQQRQTLVLSTDASQLHVLPADETLDELRWHSRSGGAPRGWGDAVLTGFRPLTQIGADYSGRIRVLVADLNGNAPVAGSKVELELPATHVASPAVCIVPRTTEPHVCDFTLTATGRGDSGVLVARIASAGRVTQGVVNVVSP
ncbi:hypothetical protein [Isoalcanivorax beigongshangi]|uniref:Big-1 domain-containing protein n=1 Tax=Isoalcanivorax beigongshangi TaxID=3238810 RepID=A0ABV4ADQ0_9GAMM